MGGCGLRDARLHADRCGRRAPRLLRAGAHLGRARGPRVRGAAFRYARARAGGGAAMTSAWTRMQRVALLLVVLAGVIGRVVPVGRPLDHRLVSPWREADHVQVARNFYRGDLDILYPQIDWRGDQPGYAEMELPVLPWLGAVLARVVGYGEAVLRVPSAIVSLLSLAL